MIVDGHARRPDRATVLTLKRENREIPVRTYKHPPAGPTPEGSIHDRNELKNLLPSGILAPAAGAGRVLNSLGTVQTEIAIPFPRRSREWLCVALLECQRCHQVAERRSPVQRHCSDCRA
jgi:hypothetical protein